MRPNHPRSHRWQLERTITCLHKCSTPVEKSGGTSANQADRDAQLNVFARTFSQRVFLLLLTGENQ